MRTRGPGTPNREWLPSDSALWETCRIVADSINGHALESQLATYFPLSPGEVALVSGDATVDEFRAAGDGRYASQTTLVAGSGTFGLALGAASLAATVIGNANRRAQAQADAQLRWRPGLQGGIVVTTNAFYLQCAQGLFRWDWNSIDLMAVAQYNCAVFQGRSASGPMTWRLSGPWTELVFALWALARHPQHPQFLDGSWLPANWIRWATDQGFPPQLEPPALARGAVSGDDAGAGLR